MYVLSAAQGEASHSTLRSLSSLSLETSVIAFHFLPLSSTDFASGISKLVYNWWITMTAIYFKLLYFCCVTFELTSCAWLFWVLNSVCYFVVNYCSLHLFWFHGFSVLNLMKILQHLKHNHFGFLNFIFILHYFSFWFNNASPSLSTTNLSALLDFCHFIIKIL